MMMLIPCVQVTKQPASEEWIAISPCRYVYILIANKIAIDIQVNER